MRSLSAVVGTLFRHSSIAFVFGSVLLAGGSASAQTEAGAHIYLFAVGMNGANTGGTSLLSGPGVVVDSNGNGYVIANAGGGFDISGRYAANCPFPDPQVYLMAVGGNSNPYNVEVSAMPVTCSQLPYVSQVTINEATTVAAAFSLAGFADVSDDGFSAKRKGAKAVADGFAYANSLVSGLTGATGAGPAQMEMNTLANLIRTCLTSAGFSACPQLMADTTVAGRSAPTNTWEAALNIALAPNNNVQSLYGLISSSLYQPAYASTPSTWQISAANVPVITSVTTDEDSEISVVVNPNGANCSQFITVVNGVVVRGAKGGGEDADDFHCSVVSQTLTFKANDELIPDGTSGAVVQVFGPGYASNPWFAANVGGEDKDAHRPAHHYGDQDGGKDHDRR